MKDSNRELVGIRVSRAQWSVMSALRRTPDKPCEWHPLLVAPVIFRDSRD